MRASEEVLVTTIAKEPGVLYYTKINEQGFVTIRKTKAGRPRKDAL